MAKQEGICGIVFDTVFAHHRTPAGHPERAARLEAIRHSLENWKRFPSLTTMPVKEADEEWLRWIHTPSMIRRVRETLGLEQVSLDPDTYTSSESYRVALLAAGSLVELTERVLEGKLERGFALVRPPGHHAESDLSMGFCLFNNVALAAEFALRNFDRVERVAIVDFDVHHGNGTQEIFYERPDVLYISSHQMPLFPGTGDWNEQGAGEGYGTTLNFPLRSGMGDEILIPLYSDLVASRLLRFGPDLLLVSAGFDAHLRDPLASLTLSSAGFGEIVRSLRGVADELNIPEAYVLEGGYDLVALAESVRATFEALLSPGTLEMEENPSYLRYRQQASARW